MLERFYNTKEKVKELIDLGFNLHVIICVYRF